MRLPNILRMGLVARIFALIAATLLLVTAAEFASVLALRAARFDAVRGDTVQFAKTTAINMDHVLESARQVLATLAQLPSPDSWDTRACSGLSATANRDFEYDHVAAVNLDGIILCTSSGSFRTGAMVPDREVLDRVVATGRFAVGSYGIGTVSRNELLRVAYPVLDAKGAVIGAIYAGINLAWLNSEIATWELPADTTLDIADAAGVIVGRYPDAESVGQHLSAGLQQLMTGHEASATETAGVDGVERLYGYMSADAAARGLAVFVGLNPVTVFEKKIDHTIWINVAIVLCGLLFAAGLAWLYVHRFLDHPIQTLVTASTQWRSGDWTARAGLATGIPEFDRLATSFDEMAATVAERDTAIQYRDSLSRAITRCASELVTGESLDDAIPRFLGLMGEAFRADRIPVIETSADGRRVLRYVWQSADAPAELTPDYLADLPASTVPEIEAWLAPLWRGEVVATSAKDANSYLKPKFEAQKIVSNLQAPIRVEGNLWGQLAIDDCRIDRSWTTAEIDALKILADLIGASIARQRRSEKMASANEVIMNSPAILFRISVDSGPPRMTYVSDNVALLGYSPAAFTADPRLFVALIHPDDRATTWTALAAAITGSAAGAFEARIATASGVYRWMEIRYTSSRDEVGRLTDVVGVLVDITEQKQAEEKLQFANMLLTTQSETSPDAIAIVDTDRRVISHNQRFLEMWNIPPSIMATQDYPAMYKIVADALKGPEAIAARVRYLYSHPTESGFDELETLDGRIIDRHTSPLRTPAGLSLGRVWFFRDVTDRKRAEAKLLEMAQLDGLTGLANRAVFADAIEQAIERVREGGKGFAVIYIDLDHFKDVNDTLGHPVGDALLKLVANRLRESVRGTDTVSRFGGDEFAVLEAGIGDPADAALLATKLLKVLTSPYPIDGNEIRSGASIGISIYGPDATDAESLLARADVALYRAKSEGRGTYRFFTDAMDAEVRTRVSLGNDLRGAIGTEQLFLEYQPQVEAATGRIIGVEALARWRHPTRGMVSPTEFIPAAERNGLIVALGHWVLREACRQARQWLDAGIAPTIMAVNLSALQFKTPLELEQDIAGALAESRLLPNMLELEITESVLMDASRDNNDALVRLRKSGVRLALDDFGTGYSSLDYLRRFPMDRIKIAQSFVLDLTPNSGSAAVVKATIGLAIELGIEVIAEGVETEAQLRLLQSWSCGDVQGFYFAQPQTAAAIEPLLRAGRIVPPPGTLKPLAA